MSVGLEEAARRLGCSLDVPLAVDFDAAALAIYRLNFPDANARVADVATLFDGLLGGRLTASERRLTRDVGIVDFLVGGPPCQGHSDLNNHTRRQDPKNALYLRMARAAEVLRPAVVVIENVASVQWDRVGVVSTTSRALECAGYRVAGQVLDLRKVGVPQRRKRFVLLATRLQDVELERLLGELADGMPNHPDRTVHWAIEDLDPMREDGTYDTASLASPENAKRINFLVPLRDRCSFGRFPWLISQALSATYVAGELRLYLERNCRLPESPSRRASRGACQFQGAEP